jgi:hypothetical protein
MSMHATHHMLASYVCSACGAQLCASVRCAPPTAQRCNAADALEGVQLPAGQAPPTPAAEGLSDEEKQQQDEAHQLVLDEAIKQVRVCVVACHGVCRTSSRRYSSTQQCTAPSSRTRWYSAEMLSAGSLPQLRAEWCSTPPDSKPAAAEQLPRVTLAGEAEGGCSGAAAAAPAQDAAQAQASPADPPAAG